MERTKTAGFFGADLPQDRTLRRGSARLLGAVAELPLRYAPFFGRLAALWQAPEPEVLRELTRAKAAHNWRASLLRGLQTFEVALDRQPNRGHARLLQLAPRFHLPKHRHRDTERVLVLEGSYADGDGFEVRAGDAQTMPQHSEHELHVLGDQPCVAAVFEQGVTFDFLSLVRALRRR